MLCHERARRLRGGRHDRNADGHTPGRLIIGAAADDRERRNDARETSAGRIARLHRPRGRGHTAQARVGMTVAWRTVPACPRSYCASSPRVRTLPRR